METPNTKVAEPQPVLLSETFLKTSHSLVDLLNQFSNVNRSYLQLIECHKGDNAVFFERSKVSLRAHVSSIRQRIKQYAVLDLPTVDVFEDNVIWTQLGYYMGFGTELLNKMEYHADSLTPPVEKPLPEGVLTIEHILDIFDGKHPLYVLIKNKIRDVQPRSTCNEYLQRLHFKSKHNNEGERFYVDYVTFCLLNKSDSDEREYLMEQIQGGNFDDMTYHMKEKTKKKKYNQP